MAYSPPPGQPYYRPQGQPYPPYQQPHWGYPPPRPTNGLAVAAFVCGLAQFVVVLTFIPAIICGHLARAQIRRTGEQGGGLALAGLIIGYVGIALFAVLVAALIVVASKAGNTVGVSSGVPVPAAPGS